MTSSRYNKRQKGVQKETLAIEYLISKGYQIKDRNFYSKSGEIDIIANHGDYLVFLEVKYRANSSMGLPHDAIDYKKMKRISKTAFYYMYKHNISMDIPIRFDVVLILNEEISLIQNAFDVML